jgi:hypothetical protein
MLKQACSDQVEGLDMTRVGRFSVKRADKKG